MGTDIGAQVMAHPRALIIAAVIALGMGLIPGMPTVVFLVLAAVLGLIRLFVRAEQSTSRRAEWRRRVRRRRRHIRWGRRNTAGGAEPTKFAPAEPVTLEISRNTGAGDR